MAITQSRMQLSDFLHGRATASPELFGRNVDTGAGGNAWEDFVAARPDLIGTPDFHLNSQPYKDYLTQTRLLAGRTPQQFIEEWNRSMGVSNPSSQGGAVLNSDGTVSMYEDTAPDIGETLVPLAMSVFAGGALASQAAALGGGAATGGYVSPELTNLVPQTGANLTGGSLAPSIGANGSSTAFKGNIFQQGGSMGDNLPLVDDWANWGSSTPSPDWYTPDGGSFGPAASDVVYGTANPTLSELNAGITLPVSQGGSIPDSVFGNLVQKVGPSATQSLLSKFFSGDMKAEDWASIGGKLLAAGLGAAGSASQAGALKDLAEKYAGYGAPSRARYEGSFAPGFTMANEPGYKDAIDESSKSILAKLSASQGNPYGTPQGLIDANKAVVSGTALPALYNYRNQNASTGGYGAYNTAAPGAATAAVGQEGNIWNALGYGLNSIVNPQPSLTDIARALKMGGLA